MSVTFVLIVDIPPGAVPAFERTSRWRWGYSLAMVVTLNDVCAQNDALSEVHIVSF